MSSRSMRRPLAAGPRFVVSIGLTMLVAACDLSTAPTFGSRSPDPDDLNATYAGSPADQALLQALTGAGGAGGWRAFRLPAPGSPLSAYVQVPENPVTLQKVILGRFLFHETALAVNNVAPEGRESYSCGACHVASANFLPNLPQGIAEGGSGFGTGGEGRYGDAAYDSDPYIPDRQPIRPLTNLNSGYTQVTLWNGALGGIGVNLGTEAQWLPDTPMESNLLGLPGLETQAHAGLRAHRMGDIEQSRVYELPEYKQLFADAYPGEPQPVNRLNAALAIAAYERVIVANEAPFQLWLRGDADAMTDQEKAGGTLFFGKAGCSSCHTGPGLTSVSFHALGMNDLDGSWALDRVDLRAFDNTVPDDVRRGRGGFTGNPDDDYQFKTPQLYNMIENPFYGHGSSFATVREVVEYKNSAISQNPYVPVDRLSSLFVPLNLAPTEIDALVAFLETSLHDPDLVRYLPDRIPSGNCFPVNDPQAQSDMGCTP